jgi:hypothetical protein
MPCPSQHINLGSILHDLDSDPTPDAVSMFIPYMGRQTGHAGKLISTRTISSCLSSLAHHLEPLLPICSGSQETYIGGSNVTQC